MDWTGPRETCPGSPSQFLSVSNTRNYTTFWDFGNGDTSNALEPMYAYPDTGTYTIKLVITDTIGCKDSLVKPNYTRVYRPVASFDANNLISYCTPFEARFTNTSTFYNSSSWELGIGTSTQTNPVSYYTSTGTYNIKLQITSPGGCTDSVTKKLQVFDPNDGTLTYGPTTFSCRPLTVNFTAFSNLKASFIWDFGDGTVIDTTVNTISHTYDNIGDFVPSIIMIEGSGCIVGKTGTAPIQIVGAKINFSVDKNFFCDSGLVTIFDSTVARGPGLNYTWDFGDGTVSNDANPGSHFYDKPGVYPLKLTVRTDNGCLDSMSVPSSIKISQTPSIRISGDSIICVNEILESTGILDKGEPAAVRWAWQFPDGVTSSVQAPPNLKFTTPGQFKISTIATNTDGCADTALKNVLVHPIPTATLPGTITIQAGDPVKIEGLYSSNVMTYDWKPTAGLSCTDCPQPIAGPKFNTKYIVRYVDSNGCANTGMVQVIVICKNANVFIPNTFSPNGDGSNDVFYVRGKGLDRVKSLRIFDRWGEVVFEKKDFAVNDASVGWDGRFRGAKPKADVYVYQVEVFCENGEIIRFDGNVALIQ
jgi:gliding motility-associated-like protein